MQAAGFNTVPMHNQILTMGAWGWVLGSKRYTSEQLKNILQNLDFSDIETRWLNTEAMKQITSFGKQYYNTSKDTLKVNKMNEPVLYRYYLQSVWDTY